MSGADHSWRLRDDDDPAERLAGLGVAVGVDGISEREDVVVDDRRELTRADPFDDAGDRPVGPVPDRATAPWRRTAR